jgi:hypothetical protein
VIITTLLDMTSYQPAVAPRISPAKLAVAGTLTVVLSIAMIFGGSLLAAVIPAAEPVMMVASVLGRVLVIAGITAGSRHGTCLTFAPHPSPAMITLQRCCRMNPSGCVRRRPLRKTARTSRRACKLTVGSPATARMSAS